MFKIYDGRKEFYQWDIDRKLIVNDNINQVHFCNRTDSCSLVCEVYEEDGQRLVNVPNILLQEDWRINVYGYDKNYTKHCAVFDVVKRTKPTDYVYTETEVVNWEAIEEKIDGIYENIDGAVKDYLDENGINVDLSGYYTKTETDNAIEQAVGAIEIPETDLSEYAKKTDIPSTTGLASEAYVDEKIEAIPEVDLTDYAKKEELIDKYYLSYKMETAISAKDKATLEEIYLRVLNYDYDFIVFTGSSNGAALSCYAHSTSLDIEISDYSKLVIPFDAINKVVTTTKWPETTFFQIPATRIRLDNVFSPTGETTNVAAAIKYMGDNFTTEEQVIALIEEHGGSGTLPVSEEGEF